MLGEPPRLATGSADIQARPHSQKVSTAAAEIEGRHCGGKHQAISTIQKRFVCFPVKALDFMSVVTTPMSKNLRRFTAAYIFPEMLVVIAIIASVGNCLSPTVYVRIAGRQIHAALSELSLITEFARTTGNGPSHIALGRSAVPAVWIARSDAVVSLCRAGWITPSAPLLVDFASSSPMPPGRYPFDPAGLRRQVPAVAVLDNEAPSLAVSLDPGIIQRLANSLASVSAGNLTPLED